jgi:Sec-independent protein translocase protein TatA
VKWWQWILVLIVLYVIFQSYGAAAVGAAAGGAVHNAATALHSFVTSL